MSPGGAIPLAMAGDPFSPNHICDPKGDRCRQSSIPELIGGLLDSYSHTHYNDNEWAFMSELTGKKVGATSGWARLHPGTLVTPSQQNLALTPMVCADDMRQPPDEFHVPTVCCTIYFLQGLVPPEYGITTGHVIRGCTHSLGL